jgi:hypothetical protein
MENICIYLYIYDLFIDAASCSRYVGSRGRVERMWKEAVIVYAGLDTPVVMKNSTFWDIT